MYIVCFSTNHKFIMVMLLKLLCHGTSSIIIIHWMKNRSNFRLEMLHHGNKKTCEVCVCQCKDKHEESSSYNDKLWGVKQDQVTCAGCDFTIPAFHHFQLIIIRWLLPITTATPIWCFTVPQTTYLQPSMLFTTILPWYSYQARTFYGL